MSDKCDDDGQWASTHRAMKEEADRVREGLANPAYIVREEWADGASRLENQIMRERRRAAGRKLELERP